LTPAFSMPAEWGPHERTLVAWPQRVEAWRGTGIEQARDSHAEVIDAISQFEPVTLVVDPAEEQDARRRVTADGVEVLPLPIDDSWLRDSGPILVNDGEGGRAGIDFRFNAWGEAFRPYDNDAAVAAGILDHLGVDRVESQMVLEGGSITVDGEGLLATTRQCLLDPSRNPGMDQAGIEEELRGQLGVSEVIWLDQGLVEDADTDGHVDNVAAFIGPGRVLLQSFTDADDPNYAAMEENRTILTAAGIQVEEMNLINRIERPDGEVVAVSYMNFYFVNGGVIVPVGGIDRDLDQDALGILATLLPDREVVGIDGRVLALGGGGIHCITQQVPAVG